MKKIRLILYSVILMIILTILPIVSKAATQNPVLYFGITELRTMSTPNLGYAIGDPNTGGATTTAAKIWNIVQYSDSNYSNPTEVNVYCVKAGVGFSDTSKEQSYNLKYDMKTERTQIAAQNSVLNNLVNNGQYNNLLALADLIYLPGVSTAEERAKLLDDAGIVDGENEFALTDDDIKATQQAAMWYFTNYGEENDKYNKYGKTSWLWYTEDGKTYKNFESYNPTSAPPNEGAGITRAENMQLLYEYLIDEAKKNGPAYENGNAEPHTVLTLYASTGNNQAQPLMEIQRTPKEFDLALRKYITKVDGTNVTNTRVPVIDESTLSDELTATYKHRKDPVLVQTNSTVTYNLTIYNEGELAGRATKIVDQLPTGLKFSKINTQGFEAQYDEETNRLTITRAENNNENLEEYKTGSLDSETIEIECIVTSTDDNKILTNVAWISEEIDENNTVITNQQGQDRDSEPATTPNVNKDNMENYKGNSNNQDELGDTNYFYKGEQDDDDFEKLIVEVPEVKEFDLALIKRITAVNGEAVDERIQGVDITKLANGTATTADYSLNKEPVSVKTGDLVTYTFRIYNEGEIDGYASEITEDIPEGLEFLGSDIDENMNSITDQDELAAVERNAEMGWKYVDGDTTKISTDYLAKGKGEEITTPGANLIKAFNPEEAYSDDPENANPDYKEISVIFKVTATDPAIGIMRNEAAITNDTDSEGNPVDDRDSKPEEWVKYEDDEDYDNIIIQEFDLALRKFITNVEGTNTIDEDDSQGVTDTTIGNVTNRVPEVSYDREQDKITYNHTKDPVEVVTGNIVTYTIRVYNEGDINGYANLISDDIPDGLKFLPENETNVEYRWVMYDENGDVTENVEEAVKIETDYLSKEQGEARMEQEGNQGEETENPNLLHAFNPNEEISEINPDYKDVKVAFEVVEPNGSDKILVNSAQISDDSDENGDPVDDIDSTPDEWNDGEDDQDKEYVKLTYFDLALRKWVTEAIVIEDGKQTITQTGHTPEMDPEPVVKVELYRKNINDVTVKFRYSIRVTNEGDIAGYAKEITDYVPEGLRFVAEDNPGWTDEGNNVISTRLLENTLLQPGEYADVEVVLTWINGEDNMGEKVNIAEISEDYNDKGVPDRDSTPDNQKPGEDDIDDAPVLLSIETGAVTTYFTLTLIILVTVAGGVFLIKKYVL